MRARVALTAGGLVLLSAVSASAVDAGRDRLDVTVVNPVVANVDPALAASDRTENGEPVIAVNPRNPNEIVIAARAGEWLRGTTYLWHSRDGGYTWTRRSSVPFPDSDEVTGVCTCDQLHDFDREGRLVSAWLGYQGIHTSTTTDPSRIEAFRWTTDESGETAFLARHQDYYWPGGWPSVPGSSDGYVDQPQVLVAPDPLDPSQDVAHVGYHDYGTFSGGPESNPEAHTFLTSSQGTETLRFGPRTTIITQPLCHCGFGASAGHKLAVDKRKGTAFAVYQVARAAYFQPANTRAQQFDTVMNTASVIEHRVTRSTDGGRSWTLGGTTDGITAFVAVSGQNANKFATMNAELAGGHNVSVDPTTGDLYWAYTSRDVTTGKDRMAVRRLQQSADSMSVGPEVIVSVLDAETALPSVAVADNGTVAVLYDAHEGFDDEGRAVIAAYLAQSVDRGETWTSTLLLRFSSVDVENPGDIRQRPLGDYQQVKANRNTFYGVFTANGRATGRPVDDWDPVFVRAEALKRD